MAVPKQKVSRARRDKRRSHHALAKPASAACPECGAPRAPHRVCAACGMYKGRAVIETQEEI